jgi:hypothetical protein
MRRPKSSTPPASADAPLLDTERSGHDDAAFVGWPGFLAFFATSEMSARRGIANGVLPKPTLYLGRSPRWSLSTLRAWAAAAERAAAAGRPIGTAKRGAR